jgi:hypothetical protein
LQKADENARKVGIPRRDFFERDGHGHVALLHQHRVGL